MRKLTLPAGEQIGLEIRMEPTVYRPKVFKRRIITPNTLPLHLGADSNGQHTFVGHMVRASIFNRVLSAGEIASLATDDGVSPETVKGCVASWDFERKEGAAFLSRGSGKALLARPVGTVTAIDTNSLRLIFHYDTLIHQAGLVPDRWVHVAATVDGETGEAILYIDGKSVKRSF